MTNTTTRLRRPLFCLSSTVAVCGSQSKSLSVLKPKILRNHRTYYSCNYHVNLDYMGLALAPIVLVLHFYCNPPKPSDQCAHCLVNVLVDNKHSFAGSYQSGCLWFRSSFLPVQNICARLVWPAVSRCMYCVFHLPCTCNFLPVTPTRKGLVC